MVRVFPRRTKWTPTDDLAFIGDPPLFRPLGPNLPVKISCAFTWDIQETLRLKRSWDRFYLNVQVGGPAFDDPGAEFVPGRFLKEGVTITSRGCPNKCKYCFVPKREGILREYPITDGWILQDNNILACSEYHQKAVFEMLSRQKKAVDFNGGLEAKLLKKWHVKEFEKMRVRQFWFACDDAKSVKYFERAAEMMGGFKYWQKRCYVLIGFNGESILEAEKRLNRVYELGFLPFAQLFQSDKKKQWTPEWDALQRKWCRPAAYNKAIKK